MRHLLLLAALLPVTAAAQTGGASARPITLAEAIRLAQQNSPTTTSARGTVNANEATVRTRWSALLPTLSTSAGGTRSGGRTFFQGELVPYRGDPWSFSRSISSNLTLFDAGDRLFNLRAARANVASAEASERSARFSVAYSVAQQYYAALAARESRAASAAALEEAEQNMRAANARVAAGAATRSDSLRSVIAVGNQRLAVLTAENDLQNANAALTRLVGSDVTVTASDADPGQLDLVPADSAELSRSLTTAPSILTAESALQAARAQSRAARTPYFPTLSMSYSMSGSNTSPNFDWGHGQFSQSNSLRLSLSFPLFNGLGREETVLRASIAEQNATASLRDARLLATQQLVQYLGQLKLALERINIMQASLEAAQEDLRVQQERYRLGASTQLELLTTQTQLNSARYNLINARYQVRIARAQIESLIGRELR
jgi:outer membrane protein